MEIKNVITEMENSLYELNCRVANADVRICEMEDQEEEFSQNTAQEAKMMIYMKEILKDLEDRSTI